ncbi:hypothetical protein ACVWYN_001207 [Pedobacter sp. UYP24]
MKTHLLAIVALLLFSACTESKMKLRAPAPENAQRSITDTVKTDSSTVSVKN